MKTVLPVHSEAQCAQVNFQGALDIDHDQVRSDAGSHHYYTIPLIPSLDQAVGFTMVSTDDIDDLGIPEIIRRVRRRVGDSPVYLR